MPAHCLEQLRAVGVAAAFDLGVFGDQLTTPDKSRHCLALGIGTKVTGSVAVRGDAVISGEGGYAARINFSTRYS
jgi:hypothetical protein